MRRLTLAALSLTAAAVLAGPPAGASTAVTFGAPVRLTTDPNFGGYEPGLIIDRWGNVLVTAHKSDYGVALSHDPSAPVPVRSQSWLWLTTDGKHFAEPPGLTPLQEQDFEFGDEGDLAHDDTGHLYFVDTNVTDVSFSRYLATGRGHLALQTTRPVLPAAQPLDDRPWIAAHGDGVVLYLGNEGNKFSYPGGRVRGGASSGPGRITAYLSYDHGDTFDPLGFTLADSGWCRPAADHRKGSHDLYALCTNDQDGGSDGMPIGDTLSRNGTLWAYSSHDDGRTWARSRVGSYRYESTTLTPYPSVAIDSRGTIYSLFNQIFASSSGVPFESHLYLYTSTTHGRTWTTREITPQPGIIDYSWLDVAPDGTLGIGYYYRPDKHSDWYVYAGTARPGRRFAVTRVSSIPVAKRTDDTPLGDFFQVAFGPDNRLNVVWTVISPWTGDNQFVSGLHSDIYYARQR